MLSLQGAWEDPHYFDVRWLWCIGAGARQVQPLDSVRYCDDGL